MPPFRRFTAVLPPQEHGDLLEWALANRERFRPSRISGARVDPALRVSQVTRDLSAVEAMLTARFTALLPEMFAGTGTRPFPAPSIELELAAHGEGAHFAAHRDTSTGRTRKLHGAIGAGGGDRILSAVYYFHREPKSFSGGELRLHRFGSDGVPGDYVDVAPEQNSLVVFPSWATHEVLAVRCPSGRFEDNRFAVNCWFCRTLEPAAGADAPA